MTEMQLKANTLLETMRSNKAKEAETNRANLASEDIKLKNYQLEKDFQPFRMIESGTKSFNNLATSVAGKKGLLGSLIPAPKW